MQRSLNVWYCCPWGKYLISILTFSMTRQINGQYLVPLGTGYQSKGCSFFFMSHLSVEK